MHPLTENIERLRGKQESLAFWQRRRRFLSVHWNKFTLEDLISLSYCYSSVMVYSCRYSPEIMSKLYNLAMEVAHQEQTGSSLPHITQEKWELAMVEPKFSGRITLNLGEDPAGESTENEAYAEESDEVYQSVKVRGQLECPQQNSNDVDHVVADGRVKGQNSSQQKGKGVEFLPQANSAVHYDQLVSPKAEQRAGTNNASVSDLSLFCVGPPKKGHISDKSSSLQKNPDYYNPLRKYQSPVNLPFNPETSDLKDGHTNFLIRSGVQKQTAWQQNSHTNPKVQNNKMYYDNISNVGGPRLRSEKNAPSPLQRVSPSVTARLTASNQLKLTSRVDTASFLNKHGMRGETSPQTNFWHPLIQTDVKEKTWTVGQTVRTQYEPTNIVNKSPRVGETVPTVTRNHQNKSTCAEIEGLPAPVHNEKKRTGPTGLQERRTCPIGLQERRTGPTGLQEKRTGPIGLQERRTGPMGLQEKTTSPIGLQENPGRKEKIVMFKTQAFPENLNKMSQSGKSREVIPKRKAGVDTKELSGALQRACESRQNVRYYSPQRSRSVGSLHKGSKHQDQSGFSGNSYVTQRQIDQSRVYNANPHGTAFSGVSSKGFHTWVEGSCKGSKHRGAQHGGGVSKSYIKELPRYKPERSSTETQRRGRTTSRVIYPSHVKKQPSSTGSRDHKEKASTGRSYLPSSNESRGPCKSQNGKPNQAVDGGHPSHKSAGGKAGNFCFKTFFQNLLQKARN